MLLVNRAVFVAGLLQIICPRNSLKVIFLACRFNEQKIEQNPEQKDAISHIVAGSSGRAPYLIFGPPGTGKTTTLVEAIKQVGAVI